MTRREEAERNSRNMEKMDRISTMLVCFRGKNGLDLYGEILNCYIDRPVCFYSIGDLILKLDEICNWIGTPQPTTNPRFLNKKMSIQYMCRTMDENKIPVKAKLKLQANKSLSAHAVRARETLMIVIEYRQNASLQGRVIGKVTSNKYVNFRSALELMRMIREIVIQADGDIKIFQER